MNNFDKYCNEISRFPILDRKTQMDLLRKGDRLSINKLVEANLRAIVEIALELWRPGIPLMDLIFEGNLAIYKAVEKSKTKSTTCFSTHIRKCAESVMCNFIKGFSQDSITEIQVDNVRGFDIKDQNTHYQIPPAISDFENKTALYELLTELDENERKIIKSYFGIDQFCALDMMAISEQKTFKISPVQVKQINNRAYRKIKARGLKIPSQNSSLKDREKLSCFLNERELLVLGLYFGFNNQKPLDYAEIAERPIFHLSFERVRQILEKAKAKLKERQKEYF